MNDHLELVETLVAKTGVSYADAKSALEASGWDMLDAIVKLEQEGKTDAKSARYSTAERIPLDEAHRSGAANTQYRSEACENMRSGWQKFWSWLREVIRQGNRNELVMERKDGSEILAVPVTAFVILLLATSGFLLFLMLVSLFFGCGYKFRGPDLGKDAINNMMNKASDAADALKQTLADETKDDGKNAQ